MVRRIVVSFCLCVMLLVVANPAMAANIWVNNSASGDWTDGTNNWSDGVKPTSTDAWLISPTVGTAVISGGISETVGAFMVIGQGQAGTTDLEIRDTSSLNVAGGPIFMGNGSLITAVGEIRVTDSANLTVAAFIDMGQFPDSTNNVYASGNSTMNVNGGFFIGNNTGTVGELGLSGSSVTTTPAVVVGQQGNGTLSVSDSAVLNISTDFLVGNFISAAVGQFNMSGGSVTAPYMTIGGIGSGTLDMTAGLIDIAGAVTVAESHMYGHIQLDGGTITAAGLDLSLVGTMSVTAGTMILENIDLTSEMQAFINSGQLDATVIFDGTNTVLTPEPASLLMLTMGSVALLRRKKRA